MSLPALTIPPAEAPAPLEGYGLPDAPALDWSFVDERMAAARYYWITTAASDGRPHAVPLWGLWFEGRLYFDGSPQTRWARNLQANPAVAAHLPDAENVVVIEGTARMLGDEELNEAGWAQLDGLYRAKYATEEGSPYWVVEPRLVLAWNGVMLGTMTRWRFGSTGTAAAG